MNRTMPDVAAHSDASSGVSASFERDARDAIEHVRVALAEVVGACRPAARRPSDLTRTLGIDKSLAWKVMRAIQSADPFAAAQLLPGPSGIEIFLEAAAEHGLPAHLMQRASERLEAYESFVRRHGGDRRTFLRILGNIAPDDAGSNGAAAAVEAAHRKAAFEANSFIWGVKARTHLSVVLVRPSDDDAEKVDIAILVAFNDLVRLRRDTPWVITRTARVSDEGVIEPSIAREPIDPAAETHEAPLMAEFCSRPLPRITRRPVPGNFLETALMSGPVGETAATTVTTGEVFRKVAPRWRDEHSEEAKFYMRLRTPAEFMVNITMVMRDEFADRPPAFGVYSELDSVLHHPVNLADLKPLTNDTSIQHIGRADSPIVWPRESPRLGELIKQTCDHLNWPLGDFDVYQARQQYPILRSVAITAFPMRSRPA